MGIPRLRGGGSPSGSGSLEESFSFLLTKPEVIQSALVPIRLRTIYQTSAYGVEKSLGLAVQEWIAVNVIAWSKGLGKQTYVRVKKVSSSEAFKVLYDIDLIVLIDGANLAARVVAEANPNGSASLAIMNTTEEANPSKIVKAIFGNMMGVVWSMNAEIRKV